MTERHTEAAQARGREITRRAAILALVHGGLAAGLYAFYTRQSLLTSFNVDRVTRGLLPAESLDPTSVAGSPGTAVGVPVLVYHGIVSHGETGNVEYETFRSHMNALKNAGYTTLTMDEFHEYMTEKRELPQRSVLITFDDGRTDSFAGADPVLRNLGFHATMFTILGDARSGKSFYLTLKETEMMARTGRWDVHSHTTDTHVDVQLDQMGKAFGHSLPSRRWDTELGRLESDQEWETRVTEDLIEARDGIAKLSGRPVYAFAYPWGDYGAGSPDPLIRRRLRQIAGSIYPLTFTQQKPTIDETCNYPFDYGRLLRRIHVLHSMSANDLLARLDRGMPKTLPFVEDGSFGSTGWALTNGEFQRSGSGRELVSVAGSNRAEVFLDGSRAWTDYAFRVRLPLGEKETVGLHARRVGPGDYLAAIVQRHYVAIEQVVGTERTTIAQKDVDLGGAAVRDVTFLVRGDAATIEVDGTEILGARGISPVLGRGGIGLTSERQNGLPVRLKLEHLSATALAPVRASADDIHLAAGSSIREPGRE